MVLSSKTIPTIYTTVTPATSRISLRGAADSLRSAEAPGET
jgi:hypothetical protein